MYVVYWVRKRFYGETTSLSESGAGYELLGDDENAVVSNGRDLDCYLDYADDVFHDVDDARRYGTPVLNNRVDKKIV